MIFKNKNLILGIFFITIIQFLLYVNNTQKVLFRYFIWNIEEIKIGKLICVSFMSGIIMSSILNNSLSPNFKKPSISEKEKEQEDKNESNDYFKKSEYDEIPPERDLRDTQPTISVNYRVVKNSNDIDNELRDFNQSSVNTRYEDDWNNNNNEW